MSRNAADVLVIGGGIMGTSAALFLARRGKSVILLESDLIGRQASGTNFGNVRRQGRPLHQMDLANRAREIWWRLPELIGEDCELVKRGHLRVATTPDLAAAMAGYAAEAQHAGLDLELISGNTLHDRFPFLGPDAVAGSFSPLDGHANPRLTGPAFGRAAVRAGAVLHENARAIAATRTGEDFEVALADGRRFRAPILLITAGAWSARFAEGFGDAAPLQVMGPQMTVTEPLPYVIGPSTSVSTPEADHSIYFRQVARGNIVIGGPRRNAVSLAFGHARVDPANILIQLDRAQKLLPLIRNARIIRSWSGVESYTPDEDPIIGQSPRVAGLYYAFGFSGSGFQLGPGVGDVIAELIATGRSPISLAPYTPARFPAEMEAGAATVPGEAMRGQPIPPASRTEPDRCPP